MDYYQDSNYNSTDAVQHRKLVRTRKYSVAAIVLSCISLLYLGILIILPSISVLGWLYIVVLILDKVLLYALPLFSILLAILGFQEEKNEYRIPALALSIISAVVIVVVVVALILASLGWAVGVFRKLADLLQCWTK